MKMLLTLAVVFLATTAHADRIQIDTFDRGVQLDAFVYSPDRPIGIVRGVILIIGGSGYTRAGYGGPSKFGKFASENGFIAIEWNKRGILTNPEVNDTRINMAVYRTAALGNLIRDGEAVVAFVRTHYSNLPLYIVGGSEGSLVTSRLAELHGDEIRAIATFGTVVSPFIQIMARQLFDRVAAMRWPDMDRDQNDELSTVEYNPAGFGLEGDFLKYVKFERIDRSGNGSISRFEMQVYLVDYFINEQSNSNYWLDSSGVPDLNSLLNAPTLYTRANKIQIPYLLLHGEDDVLTPVNYALEFEVFCKRMKLKNFSFQYYAGAGHAPSPEMLKSIVDFFGSM